MNDEITNKNVRKTTRAKSIKKLESTMLWSL